MMTVSPTCRFCQRPIPILVPFNRPTIGTVYSCYCNHCKSEQLYTNDARPLEYSFDVNAEYRIYFPNGPDKGKPYPTCQILALELGKPKAVVLEFFDFIPRNLRPDNTTLERIKTLILFS